MVGGKQVIAMMFPGVKMPTALCPNW